MAPPWFGLYLPQVRMSFDRILERTLAALEPYLLQLRLEMGAANA